MTAPRLLAYAVFRRTQTAVGRGVKYCPSQRQLRPLSQCDRAEPLSSPAGTGAEKASWIIRRRGIRDQDVKVRLGGGESHHISRGAANPHMDGRRRTLSRELRDTLGF